MAKKISEYELQAALQSISQASSSPTLVVEANATAMISGPFSTIKIGPLM
jgi:hypothetical protein